jgi:hypothetical protein
MTRLWVAGVAIRVQIQELEPVVLYWQGQAHPVGQIINRWRVDVGWWRLRICRDYYQLVTTTGLLLVVYRDGVQGMWWLQRVYD